MLVLKLRMPRHEPRWNWKGKIMAMPTIKRVRVIEVEDEMDRIEMYLETATACPTMGYDPVATMLAEKGFGAAWVRTALELEPEIVNLTEKNKTRDGWLKRHT